MPKPEDEISFKKQELFDKYRKFILDVAYDTESIGAFYYAETLLKRIVGVKISRKSYNMCQVVYSISHDSLPFSVHFDTTKLTLNEPQPTPTLHVVPKEPSFSSSFVAQAFLTKDGDIYLNELIKKAQKKELEGRKKYFFELISRL